MELKKGEISKPFIERSVSVVEEVEPKKTNKTCSDKMISFLDNPFYQAFLVLFNLIAILGTTLLDRQIDLDTTYELIMLQRNSFFCVNSLYCLDLILNIIFEGINTIYNRKKWLLVEIFQQAVLTYVVVVYFYEGDIPSIEAGVDIAIRIYFIRFIRIAEFFTELQQFSIILNTLTKFTLPFFFTMVNLYTLFYTYAYWGEYIWGGKITTKSQQILDYDEPVLYYLMNFNDFGSSMVTLFHIMVVNNWFITCNMFIDIMGNDFPKLFFVSFWILTVLIIFNLVISNIIEIYDSVEADISTKFRIIKSAK